MEDVSPLERARRDEAAIAEYRRLRDAGDRRKLLRASTGELVLYRPDEIGFVPGGAGKTVRTLAGLRTVAAVCWAFAGLSLVGLVIGLAAGPSAWAFLAPAVIGAGLGLWGSATAGREQRAAAVRRERGVPAPAKHPY